MKNKLLVVFAGLLISACSSTSHLGQSSRNKEVLTADNFEKREKVINSLLSTPVSRGVNYYSSPDSTANPLGFIPAGTEIRTLGQYGKWYRVNYTDLRPLYVLISAMNYNSGGEFNTMRPNSSNDAHLMQTGPRGGQYYINKNGNKTYIKSK